MTTEVLAAYRDAVAALERLRVALSEAGLLDAAGPVAASTASTPETPEARRRRLKTERQRRWRERLEADAGASTKRLPVDAAPSTRETPSVYRASTEASTERLHDDPKASTERLQSVYKASTDDPSGPRARARTSSEELISPPCCSLTLTTTPPLTLDGDAERQATATPAAPSSGAPEATPKARSRSPRRKPMPRERPAQPCGAAIDPSSDSPGVPTADRPPAGLGVDLASGDVGRVWSVYAETVAPTRVRLTAPRSELIKRRLRDYTVEELERSIRGYGRSPFHRGENDRGRPYQALELWLRDAAHVEAGWAHLDAVPRAAKRNGAPQLHGLNDEWAAIERRRETEALHLDVLAG